MSNISYRRKKVELTVEQKKEICNFYKENRNLTHMAITQYFSEKYQKTLNRSSITRILKQSEDILELDEKRLKVRNRSAKYPHLEEALYNCYLELRQLNVCISDEILFNKATQFAAMLNLNDFKFSNGWLHKFKSRYGLVKHRSTSEELQNKTDNEYNSVSSDQQNDETKSETKSPEEEISEFDDDNEEQHNETNHVFIEHYDFDDIDDQNNVEIDESSNLMQSNFGEIIKYLEGSEFWSKELFEATELVKKSLSLVLSAKK